MMQRVYEFKVFIKTCLDGTKINFTIYSSLHKFKLLLFPEVGFSECVTFQDTPCGDLDLNVPDHHVQMMTSEVNCPITWRAVSEVTRDQMDGLVTAFSELGVRRQEWHPVGELESQCGDVSIWSLS